MAIKNSVKITISNLINIVTAVDAKSREVSTSKVASSPGDIRILTKTPAKATAVVGERFAYVNDRVFVGASPVEVKLIIRMIQELNFNNPLWYTDTSKSNIREAIKNLKNGGILYDTKVTGFYIVNPLMLRKGSINSCIALALRIQKAIKTNPKWEISEKDLVRLSLADDFGSTDQIVMVLEELTGRS